MSPRGTGHRTAGVLLARRTLIRNFQIITTIYHVLCGFTWGFVCNLVFSIVFLYLYTNHNNTEKLLVKYLCVRNRAFPALPLPTAVTFTWTQGSSSALNDVYSNVSKIIQLIIVTSNLRHLESEILSMNFIILANEQQKLLTETLFLKLSCIMWLKRNSKKEKSFHPLIKAALLQHSLASLLVRFQKLYNYISESREAESRV